MKQSALIHLPKCKPEKVALILNKDLTPDEWKEVGAGLKMMDGAVQWWIGDWINFGVKKWEQGKYDIAVEELDFEKHRLHQFSWVCSSMKSSFRKEHLSFTHHECVAPLDPKDQVYWLNKAVEEDMSVRELREAIRRMERSDSPDLPTDKYRILYCDPPLIEIGRKTSKGFLMPIKDAEKGYAIKIIIPGDPK